MNDLIRCRICRKPSPTNGRVCLGCGTPVANARDVSKPRSGANHKCCPKCKHNGPHKTLEPGRFSCGKCWCVFEPDDGFALDDRPDVNFEKRERIQERQRRGRGM